MVLVLITFVVPPYVLMVPTYTMFSDYNLLGSLKTLMLPAMLGQGLKSAIFILIFMQFFRQIPKALDEAARVDGASELTIFFKVAIPLAVPAIIISFLFSFVWYWNETYFTGLYLGGNNLGNASSVKTMLIELNNFNEIFRQQLQAQGGWASGVKGGADANEATRMAATVITVFPLLVVYFGLQRYFVEGIDRTGITGE